MSVKQFFTPHNVARIVSFLIVTAIFHVIFGLQVLDPSNVSWLMSVRHDWGQHYLGWAAYRHEPWTFPLGTIESLCYPGGTNVGYWDSIPLIAIPLKLFSPLLTNDFQYLGIWMLFCYYMSAHYTIKIFNLYSVKPLYVITGVTIIVCNAVLVFRSMHPSLCSHWLIIASVYYYLKPATTQNVFALNRNQVVLVVLSSLIHPYMALMIAGFTIVTPFKHYFYDKVLPVKKAVLYPVVTIVTIILLWFVVGLITFGDDGTQTGVIGGYGLNSLNLNGLYNSSGFSSIVPGLEWATFHQYEGFMYLGLGMIGIVILSLIILIVSGRYKQRLKNNLWLLPLFVLVLALALFGITNKVTFNTVVLFTVPLPESAIRFGEIFRASARFFWPAFYLILFFFYLILVKSKLHKYIKILVLLALTALQLYDLKPIYTFKHLEYGAYDSPLDEAEWNKVLPGFDRIITYPPANTNLLTDHDYQDLCFLAIKHNMAISDGYAARDNVLANAAFADSLNKSLNSGIVRENEIYVTTPQYLETFKVLLDSKKVAMQVLDGYNILYSVNKNVPKVTEVATFDPLSTEGRITTFIKKIGTPGFVNDEIMYSVDSAVLNQNNLTVVGWAFLTGQVPDGTEIHLILIKDYTFIELPIIREKREGVTEYFKLKYNVNDCGYTSNYDMSKAKPGKYKVAVYLVNKALKKEGLMISDKTITK